MKEIIFSEVNMRVYVLLAEGFEELEALTPVDYLRRLDVEVVTLSCGPELTVRGAHGIPVVADRLVAQVLADEGFTATADRQVVVVPGGMPGAANVAGCQDACQLIGAVASAAGLVTALCAAPVVVLSRLGLLKGKKFTCYPTMEAQLEQWGGPDWKELTAGCTYTGSRVEVDGNLITAAGPGTAEEFSLVLAQRLVGDTAAAGLASSALFRS